MFRIDTTTAAAALPAPDAAGTPGYFAHAPAGSGVPPTVVSADWFNGVQEELVAILTYAGIAPDKTNHGQILAAILQIVGGAAGGKATVAQILAGLDDVHFVTSLGLKGAMVAQNLTDASTVAWNWALGFHAKLTVGGNRLIGQPTGLQENATGSLQLKQPAAGGPWIPSFAACFDWRKIGVPSFSTGANKMDLLTMQVVDPVTPQIVITGLVAA